MARAKGYREFLAPPTSPPPPPPERRGLSGLLGRLAGGKVPEKAGDRSFPFERAGELLRDLMVSTPPEAPHRVCITVPAWAHDVQRQSVADGARAAGWEVLALVNEPTAAAMASGLLRVGDGNVLVYDLAGEHFDVTIIATRGIEFEVLATDAVTGLNANLALPDLLAKTEAPCRRALRYAGLDANTLDTVVLVGETTRSPQTVEYVTKLFGQPSLTRFDPEKIVGFGAAVRASMLESR